MGYGVGGINSITIRYRVWGFNPCCGGIEDLEAESVLFGALAEPHCRNVHLTFLHPCCGEEGASSECSDRAKPRDRP